MSMRSTRLRAGIALAALALTAIGLVVAFLVAPTALLRGAFAEYEEPGVLEKAVALGLQDYWSSGDAAFPAPLSGLVDYWFWWHAIKVIICSLLVAVLTLLAVVLWRCSSVMERRGAGFVAVGATAAMLFDGVALVVLLANIQSTVAPLVALLQVLPGSAAEATIASTLTEIAHELDNPATSVPAVGVLIAEVQRYNGALAISSLAVGITVGWVCVVAWRRWRRARSSGQARKQWLVIAIVTGVVTLGLAGVAAVGAISAAQPAAAVMDVL